MKRAEQLLVPLAMFIGGAIGYSISPNRLLSGLTIGLIIGALVVIGIKLARVFIR